MNYRKLGNTGLEVSEIGFGGEWMDRSPEETLAVVRAAEEAGINILDACGGARRGGGGHQHPRLLDERRHAPLQPG